MILHKINSNSTWFEPMKNRTEGEIIATRKEFLKIMWICSLNPKHQTLDKESSGKYKEAIRASGMTYQLVPLNDHHRNTVLLSSAAPQIISCYTCGAKSYHKQSDNC